MWPAVKLGFEQEKFGSYVRQMTWPGWRFNKVVWHNTAAPSLAQWIKSADADRKNGLIPGTTRINNLSRFFQIDNGWSGCPHLFIANDLIWVMNSLNHPGVHSPSWNSSSLGIEMVGDFSTEDDDTGEGLKVKNNTIYATAMLMSKIGLEAIDGEVDAKHKVSGTIFIHKQDWATTHDCPGIDIARDKASMVLAVQALMAGGEHNPAGTGEIIAGNTSPSPPATRGGVTLVGDLNLRRGPGAINPSMGTLPKGLAITIIGEAKNGTTAWLRVRTPAKVEGWVSGSFVRIE